jgi:hypothetical protein
MQHGRLYPQLKYLELCPDFDYHHRAPVRCRFDFAAASGGGRFFSTPFVHAVVDLASLSVFYSGTVIGATHVYSWWVKQKVNLASPFCTVTFHEHDETGEGSDSLFHTGQSIQPWQVPNGFKQYDGPDLILLGGATFSSTLWTAWPKQYH